MQKRRLHFANSTNNKHELTCFMLTDEAAHVEAAG